MTTDRRMAEYLPDKDGTTSTLEVLPLSNIDPEKLIARATAQAKALANIVKAQHLSKRIGRREHVYVEGWCALGALNGLQAYTDDIEWDAETRTARAVVSARRVSDGLAVARATGLCSGAEEKWSTRDRFAIESMAQTRATSKVFRQALAWVMVLAGFAGTPAEEVEGEKPTPKTTVPFEPKPMTDEQWAQVRMVIVDAEGKPAEVTKSENVMGFMEDHGFTSWPDFKARGGNVQHAFLTLVGMTTFDPDKVEAPAPPK